MEHTQHQKNKKEIGRARAQRTKNNKNIEKEREKTSDSTNGITRIIALFWRSIEMGRECEMGWAMRVEGGSSSSNNSTSSTIIFTFILTSSFLFRLNSMCLYALISHCKRQTGTCTFIHFIGVYASSVFFLSFVAFSFHFKFYISVVRKLSSLALISNGGCDLCAFLCISIYSCCFEMRITFFSIFFHCSLRWWLVACFEAIECRII